METDCNPEREPREEEMEETDRRDGSGPGGGPYLGVLGRTARRGYLQAAVGSLDHEVEGVILGHHGGRRACPLGCHR